MTQSPYPRRVDGYHGDSRVSAEHVELLLGAFPDDGHFLEVGSASGTTAAILADARPNGRIVCIDTFVGLDTHTEVLLRLIDWRRNQRSNMSLWLGSLKAFVMTIDASLPFDAVFVDADHSYDCTFGCLEIGATLLTSGGALIAHDWADPNWPEVEQAVNTFVAQGEWSIVAEIPGIVSLRRKEKR